MTLTKPDFKLDKPNPNPSKITNALWWYWLRFHELEPTVKLGGIYADKNGFHNTADRLRALGRDHGQGNAKTDYSIRDAVNRRGAGMSKACAIDLTFPDAQAGKFGTIDKYTSRLLKSAMDPADPRLGLVLYDFYGQADNDLQVEGWDEFHERPASSDISHTWHQHKGILRSEVDDFWGMWAMLTVDMGWTTVRWRSSLPVAPKPPVIPKPVPPVGLPVHKLGSRVLREGMRGTDVRVLEAWIKGTSALKADGVFDKATTARVRAYQDMRGYAVDGIAGPQTLGPIVKALG